MDGRGKSFAFLMRWSGCVVRQVGRMLGATARQSRQHARLLSQALVARLWRAVTGADDSCDGEGWALSPMDVDFCGVLASLVLGLMRSVQ